MSISGSRRPLTLSATPRRDANGQEARPITSLRALLFAATMAAATPAMAGDIRVVVTNLESAGGLVSIGLHGPSDDFPSPAAMVEGRIVPAAAGAVTVTFRDLPPGRYAVAVFHDVDGDGALDTGALGLPAEPYGFSRNARGRFGPPDFDRAAFDLGDGAVEVRIELR
jgi:uncharacterized protein (DUF2141 family)